MVATQVKCPVAEYARAVLDGSIVAGRLVRLACERHLRDLDDGQERGIYWDQDAADRAIKFFSFLKHSKGEWAGQPFELEPWQKFIVGSLFGWMREDGTRRFRTAYDELGRKNGKSTLVAGIGLYLAFFDNEPGAEVYAAATKRDQAKIVWSEAKSMVEKSPALTKRIKSFALNLHMLSSASKFEPLGADSNNLDGLNTHGAIIDELHAHKTRNVWDVLRTSTGSRRQPVMFIITTAGFDRHSICWQQHDYCIKVLEGVIEDDSYFAYIATIDDGDDWKDPGVWAKANPNLGVSVKLSTLEEECNEATYMPAQQNAFRRLRLCQWTEQSDRWIDIDLWDAGKDSFDIESLKGRTCYAGLDLARVHDLSALALLFPPRQGEDERWKVLMRYWCPENNIRQRAQRDRVPYDVWADQGFIKPTEGDATDYRWIESAIVELHSQYDIREIAYDRMFAGELVASLMEEGVTMVPFGQGFLSMAMPTAELERLLLAEQIQHAGHPILRWNAANVAVRQDPAGNLKPDKEKSTERIDGIVALIMALGRATVHGDDGPSVYEERGLLTI